MSRTVIRVTALCLTLVSAFFLIKGSFLLTVKDILDLSASTYGPNIAIVGNLAQQQADTRVGFGILLISFVLQMIALWPMRWEDFGSNRKGVIISIVLSLLILGLGLFAAQSFKNKSLREVKIFLEQRRTR